MGWFKNINLVNFAKSSATRCIGTRMQQAVSEPEFFRDLVYRLRKNVGKAIFFRNNSESPLITANVQYNLQVRFINFIPMHFLL